MSKILFTLHASVFAFLFLFCTYGQNDARSKKIIDDMTARIKTYPCLSVSFSGTLNMPQDQAETKEGKIWLKNNMYKVEVPDFVMYFDGSKLYQYQPEVKEVYVSKPDPADNNEDFQFLNPQSIFNIPSKSFKSNLVKESVLNNRKVYEIDLYPVQIKTAKYSRIRIMVEKSTLQMVYLKAFMTDGTQYAITFKPYEIIQPALRDSFFTFNTLEYPGVEMIDLTF